jgi:UDP-N-acetylglucosamine 2-epimerase
MSKRKVCVIVNSRANYGRIKSVLRAIKDHRELDLQLIAGASALLWRFGNVSQQIHEDGFQTDVIVYSIVEGENPTTMAKSTGMGIMELATQFEDHGNGNRRQLHEHSVGPYPRGRGDRLH